MKHQANPYARIFENTISTTPEPRYTSNIILNKDSKKNEMRDSQTTRNRLGYSLRRKIRIFRQRCLEIGSVQEDGEVDWFSMGAIMAASL